MAGDPAAADEAFACALTTARAAHMKHFSPWWLQGRGEIALARRDVDTARELFEAALALATEIPNVRDMETSRSWLDVVAGLSPDAGSGHHRLDHAERA
jgi:hypothetical protein